MAGTPTREVGRAVLLVTAAAVLRLVFAAILPLFPDEAYYWDWSRRLAGGYFDHPPGIAVLIRLGDLFFALGAEPGAAWPVRFGPVVAGWLASVATIALASRLGGRSHSAMLAAVVMTVLPLAAAGLVLATPDAPVLAATAAALYCVVRALEQPPGSGVSLRWWVAAGVALGLGLDSKYTAVLVPAGVLAAFAVRPTLRLRLAEPGPYAACGIALVFFSPVVLWNARHDWISFAFQLHHGLSAPSNGSLLLAAWKHEGDFFGGQAGLASPILFVMLVVATALALRRPADDARFTVAMVALVTFALFLYSAVRQRVEPNWPAGAYIPAIALAATHPWGGSGRRWLKAGVGLAALMSVLIYAQGVAPVLPIPAPKDPIARAFGWRELASRAAVAGASAARARTRGTTWLAGDRYQDAAELAFYAPGRPVTFSTNVDSRPNQYDLWPRFRDLAKPGDNLVLALDESDVAPPAVRLLAPSFLGVERGDLVTLARAGRPITTRRLWLLLGWKATR